MKLGPGIHPHLWFDREAREAAEFYCSLFPNSRIVRTLTLRDTPSGEVDVIDFELSGQPFQAMSAGPMFKFNEAISLVVRCETQDEIDHYWNALSAVPGAEACGWLKDRFGLSWQIVPAALDDMMHDSDPAALGRITQAILQMKKLDLAALRAAQAGPA
jgi:predicted 3-demethylubiquinone-9 3-methyltransferase (glyoxalase superfamily)